MSKELLGTCHEVIDTNINIKIKAAQSQLPIQKTFGGNQNMSKQSNYNFDQRNPQICVDISYLNENKKTQQKQIIFRKKNLAILFAQLQKVQDNLNSYT